MPKTPEAYLKEPYSRILIPNEEGGYSAEILEFPGCIAEGETPDEAITSLEQAAHSWIEAALSQGQEIPAPYMNQGYSGKIALRLPRGLHRQAARLAARDGISLNQFLLSAIAEYVGARNCFSWLREKLQEQWSAQVQNIQNVAFNAIRSLNVSITWAPQQNLPSSFQEPAGALLMRVPISSAPVVTTATTSSEKDQGLFVSGLTEALRHG
jgi:predicted RNase H-like HicB family nuclease